MDDKKKTGVRLAKYLAAAGIASRRSCEELILQGRVCVNGVAVVTPAYTVVPETDEVTFEGKKVGEEKKAYLLLHKPAGYTCSAYDAHAQKLVFDIIPERFGRLFTVGRLDRDSEGLLLLTNDGDLAQALTHPSRQVPKRYQVSCEGTFTTEIRRQMLNGVFDGGEFLQPQSVEQRGHFRGHAELILTLCEGKKREVRRICKAVGLQVTKLQRVAFGTVELGDLSSGSWRHLTPEEVESLRQISATRIPRRRREPINSNLPPRIARATETTAPDQEDYPPTTRSPRLRQNAAAGQQDNERLIPPRAGSRPDSHPSSRPDPRSAGRPDPRSAGRPDPRSAGRPDPRGSRPDSRTGGRPDPRSAGRPDSRGDSRPGRARGGNKRSGSRQGGKRSSDG